MQTELWAKSNLPLPSCLHGRIELPSALATCLLSTATCLLSLPQHLHLHLLLSSASPTTFSCPCLLLRLAYCSHFCHLFLISFFCSYLLPPTTCHLSLIHPIYTIYIVCTIYPIYPMYLSSFIYHLSSVIYHQ